MTFASALFDGKLVSKESLAEWGRPSRQTRKTALWGLGGATLESVPGSFGMAATFRLSAFFLGIQGTNLVVAALTNTEEAM